MKMSLLKFFFLFSMMTFSSIICKADGDGPTIAVYTVPDNNNGDDTNPHRAQNYGEIYAVFDWTTNTLVLNVSSEISIVAVEIYKDGTLVIADNIPTLYYVMSLYGSGAYTILLTTDDSTTYSGYFIINQ